MDAKMCYEQRQRGREVVCVLRPDAGVKSAERSVSLSAR